MIRGGADLSNWRTSPFNRWAFDHVRELLPVADIANDPADVWQLRASGALLDEVDGASFGGSGAAALEAFAVATSDGAMGLGEALEATSTDALVVVAEGDVVYEYYANGTTAASPHIVMSATKSIVGLLAGILADRGTLRLDARVDAYLPELGETAYARTTLRELLDMRATVVLDERQQRAYAAAANWNPPEDGAPHGLADFFAGLHGRDYGPDCGSEGPFAYVSANTDLLGLVMERASGETFASLASSRLWKPLGAEAPAYVTLDRAGAARATGGLCATARDFARVGELVACGGRRGDAEIVPAAWIRDIRSCGDRDAWKNGEFGASFGPRTMSYRSGWYVVHDEPAMLFAMGIHGQNLFVDPANRLVVAKLSSQHEAIDYRASALTHRTFAEIRRCLTRSS